jgi:hypothetical protein
MARLGRMLQPVPQRLRTPPGHILTTQHRMSEVHDRVAPNFDQVDTAF